MKCNKLITAAATAMAILMGACGDKQEKFHIQGHISGAQDSTLYLEALSIERGVVVLDSARLDQEGEFAFAASDTTSCPEFYRLRIAGQVINLSIDSTETVGVEAKWPGMAFNYRVEGSGNCDTIRIMSLKLADLEKRVNEMAENRDLTMQEREQQIEEMTRLYKDTLKMFYIEQRYDKASSYYALFQTVNGYNVWDLQGSQSDVRWATAVANAWSQRYPGAVRTENLCNVVLQGMKYTRKHTVNVDLSDKVQEAGIIDMTFPDKTGAPCRLSSLKGHVVLLEFTAYADDAAKKHNIELRELYNKYHGQGLEIYQVSLDGDVHYWKTMCENLPWICVHNAEGPASDMVSLYRVQSIPTYFLIDRNCDLSARQESIPDLEAAIRALL